jgi:hypothetical protein
VLIVETTGLELRVSDTVMMNNVMQPSYTSAPDTKEMWLDSLVLARSRVGCMYRP